MTSAPQYSNISSKIQPSPIPVLAAEIDTRIAAGEELFNLTIGDFDSSIFPIPKILRDEIIEAYREGHTDYPGAKGMAQLREGACELLKRNSGAEYMENEVLIASGTRPLIYSAYLAIIDPGDKVVFPAPSWNNDYYCELTGAEQVVIPTRSENNFMPTAKDIGPLLGDATLLALCSPQNPTGTVFEPETLKEICDLVLAENKRREGKRKPLYLLMDQVYWLLSFGGQKVDIVTAICPDMKPYTILSDGISKAFASTGVRVGWAFGPAPLIAKMRTLVSHMGAWAPKPEQVATGKFLARIDAVDEYLSKMRQSIEMRLQGFHEGFQSLAERQMPVTSIEPKAAIYLSLQIRLRGKTTADGKILETTQDVHRFLLNEAHAGLLPFSYFGTDDHPDWYRLSIGTVLEADVTASIKAIEKAIDSLE